VIGKLRGRSMAELRDRLAQSARALAERRGYMHTVSVPAAMPLAPRTPWPEPDTAAILAALTASEQRALIARAERVVANRFDVLGLEGLSYGDPVAWQYDPLSGCSAPLVHWSRVPYLDDAIVGDHKVTWEVNRHQWFIVLGQAWQLTADDRYAATAARLLREWLAANPPKLGINWCSALELAFRVQSWIHGLRLFATSTVFPDSLRRELIGAAALHVDHISRNLSTWFSPNTHLTGEALAMLSAGCAWPQLERAEQWRVEGWRILCAELEKQLRADGVYFEQSAWYQAYTLDFYVLGMAWAGLAGLTIPERMPARVRAGARALRAATRPDGTIARLGDDDGGRTLPLTSTAFGDMTDSLWRAAWALDDIAVAPPTDAGRAALLWLEGPDAYARVRGDGHGGYRASQALRNGGWVVITEQAAEPSADHWLVLDAGPHGALSHAHAHADALSIDLSVHGVPLLVDPGTGAYVGDMRRRYRSTAVHNTVTVDGADSSEQGTAFNWRTAAEAHLDGFGVCASATWAAASHAGYDRLADPVRHQRTILRLDRHYWLMFDTLSAIGEHTAALTLQAASNAHVEMVAAHRFVVRAGVVGLSVAIDPRLSAVLGDRSTSPAYAREEPATAIVASARAVGSRTYCTAMGSMDESGPLDVTSLSTRSRAWRVTHANGADVVAQPAGELFQLSSVAFDGAALALLGGEEPHTVVAAGAGTLHLAGRQFELGQNDIRVARRAPDGTWMMES
jgi:Heparinase II/III-like protein/Heparinase II/III N-terminus